MNPIVALGVVLKDELVKLAMGLDPVEPLFALLYVSVDAEVCRLAAHVLAVAHTSNGIV